MGHVPHLYLAGPWTTDVIDLDERHRHHLRKVLRLTDGATLSYTNGVGRTGTGTLVPEGVRRGGESEVARDVPALMVVAVPLHDRQRNRFLIEKIAELGASQFAWFRSEFGQTRPPEKTQMWADQALEQSRGAWRMDVVEATPDQWPTPIIVAHPDGSTWPAEPPGTLLIGPEGGWSESDLRPTWHRASLGSRILRSETAAVVAVARVLAAKTDSRDE